MPDGTPASAQAVWRRWRQSESQFFFVLTVAVGILSGLAAVAFHTSIDLVDSRLLAPAAARSGVERAVCLLGVLGALSIS